MNGRPFLLRLRRAVDARRPIPDDVRQWFLDGLAAWEDSADSLDQALGLVRPAELRAVRDACLAAAAERMPEHWSGRERVRQVMRAASNLESFVGRAEDVDWHARPAWQGDVLLALEHAPLPGSRRLHDLCNPGADCTKPRRQSSLDPTKTAQANDPTN